MTGRREASKLPALAVVLKVDMIAGVRGVENEEGKCESSVQCELSLSLTLTVRRDSPRFIGRLSMGRRALRIRRGECYRIGFKFAHALSTFCDMFSAPCQR